MNLEECRARDPVAFLNRITLVSARTGCIVLNPYLELTAV
jgi:hypothetical protein